MSKWCYTRCPYNPNHIFISQMYSSHVNRCKDGKKVQKLYGKCQYNSDHILLKEDLADHEATCQTRPVNEELFKNAVVRNGGSFLSALMDTTQIRPVKNLSDNNLCELSECEECLRIIEKYMNYEENPDPLVVQEYMNLML